MAEIWPRIALCAVHDEWWAVEREHDDKCPYPSCDGPVTIYVQEPVAPASPRTDLPKEA